LRATMEIALVPCLRDNYSYLVWKEGGREAVVVDPGEAGPVLGALETRKLQLVGVLATHHHSDHVGGLSDLARRFASLRVFGHRSDRLSALTDAVDHGQDFEIAGLGFRVLHVPGHTLGAVAYVAADAVFTGDTLFVAGCGRIFEGTPQQMYASLQRICALPPGTRVYCGHEYTENNLRFALHVDPEHAPTAAQAARVAEQRKRGEPTVPSSLADELSTNPFLRRYDARELARLAARLGTEPEPVAVFGALRAAKDRW
jgi:hydroxyacylglutathione hydrolase